MEPLVVYSEQLFGGKRVLELYPDHVHIQGNAYLRSDFIADIQLNNLDPHYRTIRVRDGGFWAGLWIIIIAWGIAAILSFVFHVELSNPVLGFFATLPLAGLLLCVVTFRKIELYSFINTSGVFALNIARSRNNPHACEVFMTKLLERIHALQREKQPNTSLSNEPTQ
jgi:hypothetical protein